LKTKKTSQEFVTAIRVAASRSDVGRIVRVARAAGVDALVHAWPKLRPVERLTAFRALSPRAAAVVFEALSAEGKWLVYLGEVSEGAAPLLEDSRPSERKLLRRATKRELSAMRKVLAR
jgi:hypothetical protein